MTERRCFYGLKRRSSKLPGAPDSGVAARWAYRLHGAAHLPMAVKTLLQQGPPVARSLPGGYGFTAWLGGGYRAVEAQLDRLPGEALSLPGQSATAKHLCHEQPHLFTFLRCPGLDATNNFASGRSD